MAELNLPQNWILSTLDEVVLNTNGARKPISLSLRSEIQGPYPYYGATGQIDSLNNFTHEGEHILIGEDGANLLSKSKDLAFIVNGQFWVNNHAHAVKCIADVPAKFVASYINSLDLTPYVTGSAQPKLTKGNLDKIPVPLPPLAEQEVIAEKLDNLLAQVDNTKSRLERIPEILKSFRQSVLTAAVSGKVTEEWRLQNKDKAIEQSQILKTHKDKWETEKLKDFLEKGKLPTNQNWKQKYQSPDNVELEKTWEIPSSWSWTTIDAVASVTKLAGFEFTKYVDYSSVGEIPVLKAENVGKNGFKVTQYSRVPLKTVEMLPRSELFGDELLVTFVGAGVGQVARVPTDQKYFLGPNIAVVRNSYDQFDSKFLELLLSSNEGKSNLLSFSKGAAQPSLSMGQIRQTTIPLPHVAEQTEIVRRVEQLFAFADSIEQRANAALARVNNLTQSILAKAFRGELTADWRIANPDLISGDNSAEALLAKIKAERAKLSKKAKAKA